jgi:hypothetical protein
MRRSIIEQSSSVYCITYIAVVTDASTDSAPSSLIVSYGRICLNSNEILNSMSTPEKSHKKAAYAIVVTSFVRARAWFALQIRRK